MKKLDIIKASGVISNQDISNVNQIFFRAYQLMSYLDAFINTMQLFEKYVHHKTDHPNYQDPNMYVEDNKREAAINKNRKIEVKNEFLHNRKLEFVSERDFKHEAGIHLDKMVMPCEIIKHYASEIAKVHTQEMLDNVFNKRYSLARIVEMTTIIESSIKSWRTALDQWKEDKKPELIIKSVGDLSQEHGRIFDSIRVELKEILENTKEVNVSNIKKEYFDHEKHNVYTLGKKLYQEMYSNVIKKVDLSHFKDMSFKLTKNSFNAKTQPNLEITGINLSDSQVSELRKKILEIVEAILDGEF